jgi:hypothetical protein
MRPLQNRVDPFGNLFADRSRGLFMGNRGGRIHSAQRTLGTRRWASKQWICCVLEFNNRHRVVWGDSYTELFFLDEPTALAAGHRPCFECRRKDAERFANLWATCFKLKERPRAAEMDLVLQAERLDGRAKRHHRADFANLPDGAFVTLNDEAWAVRGGSLLRWTSSGYMERKPKPGKGVADVLTSPAILTVLTAGYEPHWHPSANA